MHWSTIFQLQLHLNLNFLQNVWPPLNHSVTLSVSSRYLFGYGNRKFAMSACSWIKWRKREGGWEKEIRKPLTVLVSDICSFWALHKSEQAASSSSDRLEDDCAVRTSINKIHHTHTHTRAFSGHNTHTHAHKHREADTHITHLWHEDEWHTSMFPSSAHYGAL